MHAPWLRRLGRFGGLRRRARHNDSTVAEQIAQAEQELHFINAYVTAASDPRRLMDLVLASTDADAACRDVAQAFGLDEQQAMAVLELQFRRLTRDQRAKIEAARRDAAARVDHLRTQVAGGAPEA